jgi:hypothetical protein
MFKKTVVRISNFWTVKFPNYQIVKHFELTPPYNVTNKSSPTDPPQGTYSIDPTWQ